MSELFTGKEHLLAENLAHDVAEYSQIEPDLFDKYQVKRGLRNIDGTGVMAGLTNICNVHGYLINDGERVADDGQLTYRGIDIQDIVNGCLKDGHFGFEEVVWLLLFGKLPSRLELDTLCELLYEYRELPEYFAEDMIIKAPSKNIMNKLARSVLALYSYDDNPDDTSLSNCVRQSLQLIARLPTIMTYAYQVKRRHFDKKSMYFHPINPEYRTAQSILNAIRPNKKFAEEEARLLDLCLMIHAEHGGGNNSTFSCRVLSSSGTDTYSAIAAAIGSLKGPKHGGANHRVMMMMDDLMANVKDWENEDEVAAYLVRILRREVGDHSGLIYGMGHAIYTKSDPRAVILKGQAAKIVSEHGMEREFRLFELVERLSPQVFASERGNTKTICANVDFYSGLVYRMLRIPDDLFTPMFAIARVPGWCAHRIEEITTNGRIMRPAYRSLSKSQAYVPIDER